VDAEIDLDNRIPAGHAAFFNSSSYTRFGYTSFFVAWPDTGALMRRLDDGKSAQGGKPGNMYVYLGADDAERQKNLAVFKNWVGDDAWSLKRRDAISKEELLKIKAKY
jgi:hypothetical protein